MKAYNLSEYRSKGSITFTVGEENERYDGIGRGSINLENLPVFEDEDGKLYLVYHQRFAKTGELHEPRVHQLFRTKDGWLVAAPFATDGETLKEDGYSGDEIKGTFYLVNHGTDISDKVHKPQRIQLNADGTVTGEELEGKWEAEEGTPYIDVTLGENTYTGVVLEMTDEAGNDTMCFSAKGDNNETIWGVKYLLP